MKQSKSISTKTHILDAAKTVLVKDGYSGLSTRAVASAADTQMSQIRYHFGSKEGMVLALFEYMNEQLIERQTDLFTDPNVNLSKKWELSCDYMDEDIESGYVRVLMELMAVGWSNPQIGLAVKNSLNLWHQLHIRLAEEFKEKYGTLGPFEAEDIAALVGPSFIGAEAYLLLGFEDQGVPVRQGLRRFGKIIEFFESRIDQEE